jgi:hypothetical protein
MRRHAVCGGSRGRGTWAPFREHFQKIFAILKKFIIFLTTRLYKLTQCQDFVFFDFQTSNNAPPKNKNRTLKNTYPLKKTYTAVVGPNVNHTGYASKEYFLRLEI